MDIVVDTNIVFSALLKSTSRIGQLLTLGSTFFNFYSVDLLKEEIERHKTKLLDLSGLTLEQLQSNIAIFYTRIHFIDTIALSDDEVNVALSLTSDIDINDTLFVALASHLEGQLWTGDNKLANGLKQKGYGNVVSTEDMYRIFKKRQI